MSDARLTPERIDELREYVSDDYTSPLGSSDRRETILALIEERDEPPVEAMSQDDWGVCFTDTRFMPWPSAAELAEKRERDAVKERDELRAEIEMLRVVAEAAEAHLVAFGPCQDAADESDDGHCDDALCSYCTLDRVVSAREVTR